MKTMLACYINAYGEAGQVQIGQRPLPEPGPGQVRLRMHAASVNPIDYKTRAGLLKALLRYRMPLILGSDVAGVIDAVGPGVTSFVPAQRVAARLVKAQIGAFAEYVIASVPQLALMPENVSFEQAAGVALAGLTAWQCLTEVLQVQPGARLLVHAGSGGVGHLAIQMGKRLGAHVTTTASAVNHVALKALGADVCIDYRTEDVARSCAPFDAVLDTQGGAILLQSLQHTVRGGAVVSIGDKPTPEVAREFGKPWLAPVFYFLSRKPRSLAKAQGVRYRYWFMREDGAQLAQLLQMLSLSQLQVWIDQRFTLPAAVAALRYAEAGKVRGKVIISP
jgi:NADPH:quinone reductase-like Zn-dependent oxidoreductase